MNIIRAGIIGTGYTIGIAKEHIKAYRAVEGIELVALYDLVPGRAAEFARVNGLENVAICGSLEELFAKTDAVSICVPNDQHVVVAMKVIDAGKHFICEKPLAVSEVEGKKLLDYLNNHKNKVIGLIGFNYRDFPAVAYAKSIIDEGKIGRVFTCVQQMGGGRIANPTGVKLEWRMQAARSGPGAVADFGCHMFDLALYLLPESSGRIREVQAFSNTFVNERFVIESEGPSGAKALDAKGKVTNDDCAVFNAMTSGGTLLSFHASRIGMTFETLQIIGDGGMLYFSGKEPAKLGVQLKDKNGGYTSPYEYKDVPAEFCGREWHIGLVTDFVAAITRGVPSERTVERGLYVQHIIETVVKSAEQGKTLVVD